MGCPPKPPPVGNPPDPGALAGGATNVAIYRLNLSHGSRGKGNSARAASDYQDRAGRYREREPTAIAPVTGQGNMPAWVKSPGDFWDAADATERANGRLYGRFVVSLPRELDARAQAELTEQYFSAVFGEHCLPWSWSMHRTGADTHNPHVHVMYTERGNDGIDRTPETWFRRAANTGSDPATGGARKVRAVKPKAWLQGVRQRWQDYANAALAAAGIDARIDHRSLEARGIDHLPQPKLGPAAAGMEARGIETAAGDELRRIAAINAALAAPIDTTGETANVRLTPDYTAGSTRRPRRAPARRAALDAAGARRAADGASAPDRERRKRNRKRDRSDQRGSANLLCRDNFNARVRERRERIARDAQRTAEGLGAAVGGTDRGAGGSIPESRRNGGAEQRVDPGGVSALPPRNLANAAGVGRGESLSPGRQGRYAAGTVHSTRRSTGAPGAGPVAARRTDQLAKLPAWGFAGARVAWTEMPGYVVASEVKGQRVLRRVADDPDRVRLVDRGKRLVLGKDGEKADLDAMLLAAAARWDVVRLLCPHMDDALVWVRRAHALGVAVGTVSLDGGAEHQAADLLHSAAAAEPKPVQAADPKPKPKPSRPDPGPSMG